MYNTNIGNNDKLIGFGLLLMALLIVMGVFLPGSHSGNINEYQEREILFKHEIARKERLIKSLQDQNNTWSAAYAKQSDSVRELLSKTPPIKEDYKQAVEQTYAKPDSANLANEVKVSRVLIANQEQDINALLDLNVSANKLLDKRLEIIQRQDSLIIDQRDRFNNILIVKDQRIKEERKKGNKKFIKGIGVGAAITLVLVLI